MIPILLFMVTDIFDDRLIYNAYFLDSNGRGRYSKCDGEIKNLSNLMRTSFRYNLFEYTNCAIEIEIKTITPIKMRWFK